MDWDIEIPESIAEQLLVLAAQQEVSVEEIVEKALRDLLKERGDENVW